MDRAIANVTGPAVLGWRSARRLVHAAVLDNPSALYHLAAAIAQRGLPAVLSSRLPIPAPTMPPTPSTNCIAHP